MIKVIPGSTPRNRRFLDNPVGMAENEFFI